MLTGDLDAMQPPEACQDEVAILLPGEAEGRLLGGCLSVFACAIGTPFQPCTQDAILFLEDRGERLYAIDRLLTTLKLSGLLQGVRGLVFGRFDRVEADAHMPYDAQDVIVDVLGDLHIPILYGFPSGHCSRPLTLPFGVPRGYSRWTAGAVRVAGYDAGLLNMQQLDAYLRQSVACGDVPGAVCLRGASGQKWCGMRAYGAAAWMPERRAMRLRYALRYCLADQGDGHHAAWYWGHKAMASWNWTIRCGVSTRPYRATWARSPLRQLLSHSGGFADWLPLYDIAGSQNGTPRQRRRRAAAADLE